jgi:SAM-dependent methyltransferase
MRFEAVDWHCPACGRRPVSVDDTGVATDVTGAGEKTFDGGYFAPLAELEAENFWFRSRAALLAWAIRRYFRPAPALLELGTGTGFTLAEITRHVTDLVPVGSELFAPGIAIAQRRLPGVEILCLDARDLPYEAEFDVVGAFDVLEHIEDDRLILRQMFKAARPGGGIVVTVPQHPWLWSPVDEYAYHKRRYTRVELRDKAEAAGFQITRLTSFCSFLLPLMALSRLRPGRSGSDFVEFRLGRMTNRLFEEILSVERALIRRGLSFPAGGSLLLVAHRRA